MGVFKFCNSLDVVGAFFFGEVSRPNLGVERAKGFENLFILLNERARLDPFLISENVRKMSRIIPQLPIIFWSKTVADLLSKLRKNKFKNLSDLITYLMHKLKILLKFPRKIPCTLDFSCVQFLTAIFLQLGPWNLLMKPRLMPQDPRDVPDYPADKRRPAP